MSRQALYRKYRSRALDEIVGQKHVTDTLAKALKKQQFSHAYLLTGPRGIGKTSVARIIAHVVNDLPYDDSQHLDIVEIDAASNNGVDDVRDLREKVNIAPISAKYKIYIIDEVHMLSGAAFNALLKTLEEPPAHVIFILATTEVQKLPATILSRVQRYHFRPVAAETVAKHLGMIAKKEKIDIDDEALLLIAERGGGSFRDSIGLLDQLSGTNEKITRQIVEDILGLASAEIISELVENIIAHNPARVVEILNQFKAEGIAPAIVVEQLVSQLEQLAVEKPKLYDLIERLIEVPKSANPDIKLLAILASASAKNINVAQSAPAISTVEAPLSAIKKADGDAEKLAAAISESITKEMTEKSTAAVPSQIVWHEVVDEVRKLNPPLASVVDKAKIDYEKGSLTMYFRYKIHRSKMDDSRYRQVLAQAFSNIYRFSPRITVAPGPKPAETSSNATIAKVAAIMGGGDEV